MTLPPMPDLHKAAQAAHIALTCISTHPTLDISDYLRRRVDAAAAGLESALAAVPAQPVAWIDKNGNIKNGLDALLTPNEWFTPLYAAPQAVPVPAGMALVPFKPTPAMRDAMRISSRRDYPSDELCNVRYAAMLAAAPKGQP